MNKIALICFTRFQFLTPYNQKVRDNYAEMLLNGRRHRLIAPRFS